MPQVSAWCCDWLLPDRRPQSLTKVVSGTRWQSNVRSKPPHPRRPTTVNLNANYQCITIAIVDQEKLSISIKAIYPGNLGVEYAQSGEV
jgi:hypothetical protein